MDDPILNSIINQNDKDKTLAQQQLTEQNLQEQAKTLRNEQINSVSDDIVNKNDQTKALAQQNLTQTTKELRDLQDAALRKIKEADRINERDKLTEQLRELKDKRFGLGENFASRNSEIYLYEQKIQNTKRYESIRSSYLKKYKPSSLNKGQLWPVTGVKVAYNGLFDNRFLNNQEKKQSKETAKEKKEEKPAKANNSTPVALATGGLDTAVTLQLSNYDYSGWVGIAFHPQFSFDIQYLGAYIDIYTEELKLEKEAQVALFEIGEFKNSSYSFYKQPKFLAQANIPTEKDIKDEKKLVTRYYQNFVYQSIAPIRVGFPKLYAVMAYYVKARADNKYRDRFVFSKYALPEYDNTNEAKFRNSIDWNNALVKNLGYCEAPIFAKAPNNTEYSSSTYGEIKELNINVILADYSDRTDAGFAINTIPLSASFATSGLLQNEQRTFPVWYGLNDNNKIISSTIPGTPFSSISNPYMRSRFDYVIAYMTGEMTGQGGVIKSNVLGYLGSMGATEQQVKQGLYMSLMEEDGYYHPIAVNGGPPEAGMPGGSFGLDKYGYTQSNSNINDATEINGKLYLPPFNGATIEFWAYLPLIADPRDPLVDPSCPYYPGEPSWCLHEPYTYSDADIRVSFSLGFGSFRCLYRVAKQSYIEPGNPLLQWSYLYREYILFFAENVYGDGIFSGIGGSDETPNAPIPAQVNIGSWNHFSINRIVNPDGTGQMTKYFINGELFSTTESSVVDKRIDNITLYTQMVQGITGGYVVNNYWGFMYQVGKEGPIEEDTFKLYGLTVATRPLRTEKFTPSAPSFLL